MRQQPTVGAFTAALVALVVAAALAVAFVALATDDDERPARAVVTVETRR